MQKVFMKAGVVEGQTRDAVSNVLQQRVERAVGNRPLAPQEIRGIKDMPNHFIGARSQHNSRAHVASTKVDGQVVYIHEVPQF